ncbi:invasion associated locus B family protein [Bradyrhizobium sp.]|uniref:invasion associated locus B family protein n=1 Tax=Bradyrhizobium sp. TaxID=376 RepID=UPI0039E5076E
MAVAAMLTMAASASAQTAEGGKPSASLPGGSSSLQETFDGWTLQCTATEKGRLCNIQQQQRHRETKQLVLAAELEAVPNGAANGSLVLPFGLRLSSGVTLQIDDQPSPQPLAFSTCLPVGCVVPLSLDKAAVGRLRGGATLKVGAIASEDGKPIAMSIQLKGLAPALDRLATLVQPGSVPKDKKQ